MPSAAARYFRRRSTAPPLTISQTLIEGNLVQAGSDSGGGFTDEAMGGGIYDSGAELAISSIS